MHWDFRLELDGVLLSWAVPKGPSLDTREKRLAMRVEDHPLDYADFEGVIPAGEYGAGKVIVWDRGTWEPTTDPHAGLAKGDFKFRLEGEKLVGGWVLVRLKPRPNERGESWLLIKERDEYVRPAGEYSITVERPESVVSGLTVDEVGSDGGAPGVQAHGSAGSPPVTPPERSEPTGVPTGQEAPGTPAAIGSDPLVAPPALALCTLVSVPPDGDDWLGEVKYDGYRLTIALERQEARCFTRNGEDISAKLEPIAAAASALPATTALLDGEIVVFDERGISRFGALQEALSTAPERITFVAFDLLHLNGHDIRALPTTTRKDLLRTLLADQGASSPLRFAEHVDGGVPAMMEVACAQGLEGVVAKRADSPYPEGRTRSWLKIKCRRSQEFVVGGYTEPRGSRIGFGALLLGYYEGGRLVYAGRAGSGFSDKQLTEIHAQLASTRARRAALRRAALHRRRTLGRAAARCTGRLRRVDLGGPSAPTELPWLSGRQGPPGSDPRAGSRLVTSAESGDADGTAAAGGARGVTDAAVPLHGGGPPGTPDTVAGVRITNPGKQLFPDSPLTKLDLARYYEAIAPIMLREAGERPLTLVRCPVGDGRGTCFYQRHPDKGLPQQIGTLSHVLTGHDEADELIVVEDAAGLVALAQMGVAEIHTWLSRTDAPTRPDRIVFDLDPGPGVEWPAIVSAAHVVARECSALGFTPFVKSTGSKGLHVVMPIEPVWEFERIRALARLIAEKTAALDPDALTSKMSKALRPGRIFIDYVRNSEGASAVAPYSTRYLEGPPVAVPLAWDELDAANDVRRLFTPARVLERVASGTDPWAEMPDTAAGSRVLKAAEAELGG